MGAPQNPLNDPDATTGGDFLFGEDKEEENGRKPFSPDEMCAGLSALIQTCDGCEKVKVLEVTRLDPPDASGCNWSTSVVLDPAGVEPEVYSLAYATIVFMARTSWNLK